MGTIWVKEFTGGLDTRRIPETAKGGTLIRALDGHINRGGEFEKRAMFEATYQLPVGTVGIAHTIAGIYVFGSVSTPAGIPSGVTYQRLQHTDGTTALTRILSFDLYAGLIYVVGEFADGERFHFYNGVRVADIPDGRAVASFNVTGGDGVGPSQLLTLLVDGVAIISGAVSWTTDHATTAAAIATAINSDTSTPDYTATSVAARVNIIAAVAGPVANGKTVTYTVGAGLTLSKPSGSFTMAGGSAAVTDLPPGTFIKTIGSRVCAVAGPIFEFSGISDPIHWTTDVVGAGFIDMSTQAAGSEKLTALGVYQNWVAIFAKSAVQIWLVDSDPTNNAKAQTLANTGSSCAGSITQFGDSDLFYLADSGLRSLRARDASNSAATSDIGVPVDTLISAKVRAMTDTQRDQVRGLIEPSAGRFWLIMGDQIFVFTFFPSAKISAWSIYEPAYYDVDGNKIPFTITDATIFNRRLYVRAGDVIFCYGGLATGEAFDQTRADVWLPFLDGGAPAAAKQWSGVDAAIRGVWQVYAGMQPTEDGSANDTDAEQIAVIDKTTYNLQRIPFEGKSTHVALRFVSVGTGPALLSSCAIHYEGKDVAT